MSMENQSQQLVSDEQELKYKNGNNVVAPLVFWFLSNIIFMLALNHGNIPSIAFGFGFFASSSIPSLLVGGIVCLIFKRLRNWRTFLFGAITINILLSILSFIIKAYMNSYMN